MLSYRIRDRTARWKAIAACTVTWQVQSAAYQKLTAKKKSCVKPGRLTNRLRSWTSSTPSPTSTALLVFLWPQPPPLEGAQRPTDLCLSVVHAFISDHTRRFRPEIHEDENACGCGILIVFSPTSHTDAHVMYKLEDAPATVQRPVAILTRLRLYQGSAEVYQLPSILTCDSFRPPTRPFHLG